MRGRRRAAGGVFLLPLVAGWLVGSAAAATAQTGERILTFDVDLVVTADGDLEVVESITYDFGMAERRGIFRTIPVRSQLPQVVSFPVPGDTDEFLRAIDLTDVRVSSATAPTDVELDRPGPVSRAGDALRIRIGDPDVTISGVHTYRIAYRVRGALDGFAGADPDVAWDATGDAWEVPIDVATVTVRGPRVTRALCLRGTFGSTTSCEVGGLDDGVARYRATDLGPGTGVTVVAGFAPGTVTVPEPLLVRRWSVRSALAGSPWALPLGLATAVLGLGGVLALAWRQGRDRELVGGVDSHGVVSGAAFERRRPLLEPRTVPVRYRPPEGLRPGQLGVLVDERVDRVDVTATVVDLAVRGHLRIEEGRTVKVLWRESTEFTLRATPERVAPEDPPLLAYERRLLDGLFQEGDTVELEELRGAFAQRYAAVATEMYEDVAAQGWFPTRPDRVRSRWTAIGVAALVASTALFVAALLLTTLAAAVLPLVLASLVLVVAAGRMPHRTAEGSRLLVEALGYREFVVTAESGRMAFAEAQQAFVTGLPYAIVFGVAELWAARFADLGLVTQELVSSWYAGRGPFTGDGFTANLGRLDSGLGTSLATAPSSSSGSGGSGFSGGAGGGFGGGGGGSW
ncbi:MAG: DUF2207 domain-containing protein [Actinomycetes bacterium]